MENEDDEEEEEGVRNEERRQIMHPGEWITGDKEEKELHELKKKSNTSTVSDAAGLNGTTWEGNSTCTTSLALPKDSPP